MIKLFKRLFGAQPSPAMAKSADPRGTPLSGATRPPTALPSAPVVAERVPGGAHEGGRVVERYFELSAVIDRGKANRDYRSAIAAARETYPLLSEVVRQWKRQYGGFDIKTSHAVHTAATLMAVLEDREGLRELRAALEGLPELRDWLPAAWQAEEDVELVVGILGAVHREPGLVQSGLKAQLGATHRRRVSQLVGLLEKGGRIRRVKKGSGYQLYPAGHPICSVSVTAAHPSAAVASASPGPGSGADARPAPSTQPIALVFRSRPRRSASRAREIEFGALPYVRLPKAPAKWEERRQREAEGGAERVWAEAARAEGAAARETAPRFAAEGEGWRIISEDKLGRDERPDPAYKDVFPTSGSTFWLDAKGSREGFEDAVSVLRVTDRTGALVAERGLGHDVYRTDVNTAGTAILFMSREGVLHGYSYQIEQLLAERVEDLPEYRAQAERLGIESRELRTHVRCVAISGDRSRYLVSVVDEAWCISATSGEALWGLRLPAQEGWTKAATSRTDRAGTSAEVEAALLLMELELPVAPEDIRRQYRQLALRWHPDRNPGDTDATRRFQELGAAMELLTGADLRGIGGGEVERVTYQKILKRERIEVPVQGIPRGALGLEITVGMGVSEKGAADWIYAANFATSDNRVFMAGYSGKVVEVSDRGIPVRVYDIGAVPRHIAETDSHLYLLTDTRLYVLSGDRLEALLDVFEQGHLVVGDTGFGLLEPKAFSWFAPTGRPIGRMRTKDPIRRVLSVPQGLVVETRQHRATVAGAPSWWRA